MVVGCTPQKLAGVEGELRVAPQALEVQGYVGFPIDHSVEVSNGGRGTLSVAVAGSAGVTLLGAGAIEVASGQSLKVKFRLKDEVVGPVSELLTFTAENRSVEVPVTGEMLVPPTCGAAQACQAMHFDPSSGACVSSALADGTACAAACLEAASCQAGKCLGTLKSCDDKNACTQDSCGPDGQCVHLDTSARCQGTARAAPCKDPGCNGDSNVPVHTDPCSAPICDPKVGCTRVEVPDGTLCGVNDCTLTRVCMAGVCQVLSAPEGSVCSEATPCKSEGKCVANNCLAAIHPLTSSWEVLDTPTVKHTLLGVVTPAGLIFGIEKMAAGIVIVAWDSNGFERWRTPVIADSYGWQALYDAERTQLVLASKAWVRAIDATTGVQRWFVDLDSQIPLGNATPTGAKQVYPGKMTMLQGAKKLIATFGEGSEAHVVWVFGLDLGSGAQTFKVRRDGHLYGLMATSTDEVFLGTAACWAPASWNAVYDAAGVEKWNVFQAGTPSLASGAQVYFQPNSGGAVNVGRIDLATGAMGQEAQGNSRALLANGSTLFVTPGTASHITRWDTAAHHALWTTNPGAFDQAFLTEGDGVLTMSTSQAGLMDGAGKMKWSCAIGPLTTAQTASLTGKQIVGQSSTGIVAYPVGPVKVSPTGWSVSDRGNPEHTNRSR